MIEMVKFHCFKCITKVEENDVIGGEYLVHNEPFLNNTCNKRTINKYSFFGHNYNESVWMSDAKQLFCVAKKGIKQLEQAALKTDNSTHTVNYLEIRNQLCELWLAARDVIFKYGDKNEYAEILKNVIFTMKEITKNMTKLSELPDYVIFNSMKSTDIRFNASYNYLHLYLDLKWISLTTELNSLILNKENLEENITLVFNDLIHIGIKKFERNISNLDNNSPYLCSCFKELWLLLQLLIEKNEYSQSLNDFWSYFNQTVKVKLNFHTNSDGKDALCCLWLLYNIAKIQGCNAEGIFIGQHNSRVVSNYSLVEECLKLILQSTCDEKRMRTTLQLITFLQVNWWTKDATFDLLQMQWEHFYKRIYASFALTTDTIVFVNTSQKLCNFVDFTNNILHCNLHSSTSYEIFLYLLSYFLKGNPSFWSKLKGRIYSKLSVSKLATFNDVGLQNLIVLIFILAHSVNFNELTEKLLNLLNQLPRNRCEDNSVIWSAHISLIIFYIKHNISVNIISNSLLNLVEQASVNRSRSHLIRLFIDGLNIIEEISTNLQYGQHVLFGSWGFLVRWERRFKVQKTFLRILSGVIRRAIVDSCLSLLLPPPVK